MTALVAPVIARLKDEVPALHGRVEGAAALADLMRRNDMPQATPAAFVVPEGIAGGPVTALTGAYRQEVARRVAVIVAFRTHDRGGARAIDDAETLVEAIVAALAGWTPDRTTTGVTRFDRSRITHMQAGTMVIEITFTLTDFLRFP